MQGDIGWQHWAAFFERMRRGQDRWEKGEIPKSDLVYLFVDGFYSSSTAHWVNVIEPRFDGSGCRGQSCGFSYRGIGKAYNTDDTQKNVRIPARHLADYVRKSASPVIPIAFSLGTIVTLLGVGQWLQEPDNLPAQHVPAVILIAPAYSASVDLYRSYDHMIVEDARKRREVQEKGIAVAVSDPEDDRPMMSIPDVIRQISGGREEIEKTSRQSMETIVSAGIHLAIIHWPNDALTPYVSENLNLTDQGHFVVHPVREDHPLRGLSFAPSEHIRIRDWKPTVDRLLAILSAL
jgi:predicted alpha/beta hydrolase family esterase